MIMSRWLVHLTTLFPGQAWTSSAPVLCEHTFTCNWQQPFLNESAEGKKMALEIISWSIYTEVWARIELTTPWSAVRHASVVRHVTDCAMQPENHSWGEEKSILTFILGAEKSSHWPTTLCFGWEIINNIFNCVILSRGRIHYLLHISTQSHLQIHCQTKLVVSLEKNRFIHY